MNTNAQKSTGRYAINALLKSDKGTPKFKDKSEAINFLEECLQDANLFAPARMLVKRKLVFSGFPSEIAKFDEEGLYVLLYEGSKLKSYLQGLGILTAVFSFVVIQIWPEKPRRIAYYVTVVITIALVLILIISLLRIVVNILCKLLLGKDLWIFPNLFEEVDLKDVLRPLYKVYGPSDEAKVKKKGHEDNEGAYQEVSEHDDDNAGPPDHSAGDAGSKSNDEGGAEEPLGAKSPGSSGS